MKVVVVAAALLSTTIAHAAPDDYAGATVIFARGDALFRTDPRGKGETEVAKLPAKSIVRALRTDATGSVLLANIGGKWSWMPLDGKATALAELPCADGPAQLATDGACVLCRSSTNATGSVIVNFGTGKVSAIPAPAPGARLVGAGPARRVIWADTTGVWSAPPGDPKKKTLVAGEAPLRSFLPSSDGSRAVGVYLDKIHDSVKTTKPAELLMTFALDGQAARRKAIKSGVPVEWSHDNQWVLLQDCGSACIMSAVGGQYKCWKGYTGASIAADGKWALILGDRNAKASAKPKKASKKDAKKKPAPDAEPSNESENSSGDDAPHDDVEVPPPTGPLALYRAQLEGAFTTAPALIVRVVDGAAVWIPGPVAAAASD